MRGLVLFLALITVVSAATGKNNDGEFKNYRCGLLTTSCRNFNSVKGYKRKAGPKDIMSDEELERVYNDILESTNKVYKAVDKLKRAVGLNGCNSDMEDCAGERNKPHISQVGAVKRSYRRGGNHAGKMWFHSKKDAVRDRVGAGGGGGSEGPWLRDSVRQNDGKVPFYHF